MKRDSALLLGHGPRNDGLSRELLGLRPAWTCLFPDTASAETISYLT